MRNAGMAPPNRTPGRARKRASVPVILAASNLVAFTAVAGDIGRELSVPRHLADGEEFSLPTVELVDHGRLLFEAMWTVQEGGGRPETTGTGAPLADIGSPLTFPRNFNRISGPDANACAGCHNRPRSGGAGDRVANVFVLGQRFDFATFDSEDLTPTRGGRDENGDPVELRTIANERNTVGMFGAGYIEMLARRMTATLRSLRDTLEPGDSIGLTANGVDFGMLSRDADGNWDTSAVEGLPAPSLASGGPHEPPSLVIRPFHQAGAVVSLREFSNNAFNHHHGIQSVERFGTGDPDGDGHVAELTRADITAVAVYQATLGVPGRVIPRDPVVEQAVLQGEALFREIGCADCHLPSLELGRDGWLYSEPNPYNPDQNLHQGEAPELVVDLNSPRLDPPRLDAVGGQVQVPAYTDLKLHDITSGPDDPNCEPLDMHHPPGSAGFFGGNCRFLTGRLWGVASSAPYFHHGRFTTLREAVEAHAGEAAASRSRWDELSDPERNALIEFLKSHQVLPEGTRHRIVDERFRRRVWPPAVNQERAGT